MHFVITGIHTEITVNTYIQHIQATPITINTVITTHRINHKNKHVNNNVSCKFITQLTLILVRISPTMCRPSTNLPALDYTTHHSQQWVTPEMGLNSTMVKGFLTRIMDHGQQERLCHKCLLKLTAYSPSFPTCLSHPRKCSPSLLNSPSTAPLPFWASTTGRTGSLKAL
jgi:hypothetical protein